MKECYIAPWRYNHQNPDCGTLKQQTSLALQQIICKGEKYGDRRKGLSTTGDFAFDRTFGSLEVFLVINWRGATDV